MARKEYLSFCVRRDTPKRWKVLHCANASDMTDEAFRQLFTYVAYAKSDLSDASASHKTMALVTGRSMIASKRATKELSDAGWIETKRRRREEASRRLTIPKFILDAIPDAALEPPSVTAQDTTCRGIKDDTSRALRSVNGDTSKSLEVSKTALRSITGDTQTILTRKKKSASERDETHSRSFSKTEPPAKKANGTTTSANGKAISMPKFTGPAIIRSDGAISLSSELEAHAVKAAGTFADRFPAAWVIIQAKHADLSDETLCHGVVRVGHYLRHGYRPVEAVRVVFTENHH